jgi:hypothetical protein
VEAPEEIGTSRDCASANPSLRHPGEMQALLQARVWVSSASHDDAIAGRQVRYVEPGCFVDAENSKSAGAAE